MARILIAEDDPTSLELLKGRLQEWGHDVLPAADGAEALRGLEGTRVDLVISDWKMPRVDGLELCRLLKGAEATRELPFIMLTTKKDSAARDAALENGADEYITKPFDRNALLAAIERLTPDS